MSIIKKPFKYTFYNASLVIIGINIAVFMILQSMPNLTYLLALNVKYLIAGKMYWQVFTYMFVHTTFSHLFFNMLGLFFFGIAVERAIGSKEFVLLYITSGLACGIISFVAYFLGGAFSVFLLGASGAIYAVLLSYAVVFPRSNIFIWGILPVPAPILVAVYAGIEIFSQLTGSRNGVAHMTHLAGFAYAYIYFIVRMGINPWKIWKQNYF